MGKKYSKKEVQNLYNQKKCSNFVPEFWGGQFLVKVKVVSVILDNKNTLRYKKKGTIYELTLILF